VDAPQVEQVGLEENLAVVIERRSGCTPVRHRPASQSGRAVSEPPLSGGA
jgi:hypothetical protein